MTNKDKKLLASALLHQAGNLIDVYQDKSGYHSDIEHLDVEEVREQLCIWLKNIPFDYWDTRLKDK